MAGYVIVLPTHWSPPFVVLGERLEPDESHRRIRVIKSWGLARIPALRLRPDGDAWAMYVENANAEWKDVVLNYIAPHAGGPSELVIRRGDLAHALAIFHAINTSWQMWLGGVEERVGLTDEQRRRLYGEHDLCVSQSAA